jgi:hypothetical protein
MHNEMTSIGNQLRMPPQVAPCMRTLAGSVLADGSGVDASWGSFRMPSFHMPSLGSLLPVGIDLLTGASPIAIGRDALGAITS